MIEEKPKSEKSGPVAGLGSQLFEETMSNQMTDSHAAKRASAGREIVFVLEFLLSSFCQGRLGPLPLTCPFHRAMVEVGNRHVALAIKIAATLNHERCRMDIAQYNSVCLNFDLFSSTNCSLNFSGDTDEPCADLSFHFALVSDDHSAGTIDLAL